MEAIDQVTPPNQGVVQSWRDVLLIHPAADLLPRISSAELQELSEDIKKRGLINPITIFKADLGSSQLLDGINWLDAMELAGIAVIKNGELDRDVVECREVNGDTDPHAYVLSVNLHRRHLNAEQKRELIIKVLEQKPQLSNRQISKMVVADHKTVAKARTEGENVGKLPHVEKLNDSKGRKQSARKPKSRKGAAVSAKATEVEGAKKLTRAVSPKDCGLVAFTARVLEIVRQIGKHKPMRFVETSVPANDLAKVGKFLSDLADLKVA